MTYIWSWAQTIKSELGSDERGATMVEYGLLIALIAILLVTAILAMTGALSGLFGDVETELEKTHVITP